MAEDEPYVRRSVKDLAAGLRQGEVGRVPSTSKPAKPLVKPRIERSQSASVPPVDSSSGVIGNLPADTSSGHAPIPTLPPRRPGARPPPPSVPPHRETAEVQSKPPVPGLSPRRPTAGPSLPPRRPSESSATTNGSPLALPPRNTPGQPELPRRQPSQASIQSTASAVSDGSRLSSSSVQTNGTARTLSSSDQSRVRAPAFDPSTLPVLPPKREKKEGHESQPPQLPTRSKSSTSPRTDVKGDSPPPVLPTRPGGSVPSQPARRLPPTIIPPPGPRPQNAQRTTNGTNKLGATNGQASTTQAAGVVILTSRNFDEVITKSGKPALVDFSANFCKYCKELDPIYDELGNDYRHVSDQLVIAKIDCAVEKSLGTRFSIEGWPTIKWFDGKGSPPEVYPYQRSYEALARFVEDKTGFKAQKTPGNAAPPPVPLGSRPDLSAIMRTKPKAQAQVQPQAQAQAATDGCLICRDFTGPDQHAARFPRETVQSVDQLAYDLTSPFSSETDKARAIFTWMHHNVAYDTKSFFSGNIGPQTPLNTLRSGLAVCQGYAELFCDLALKAGLESVLVSGHGKGFGHSQLAAGASIPSESSNHAWSAIKIDFGGPQGNSERYWKLVDPCWGAGYLDTADGNQFKKKFNPTEFCKNNIDFGRTHFPSNRAQQFREDGRTITWDEYFVGTEGGAPPTVYGAEQEGISKVGFEPKLNGVSVNPNAYPETGGVVRFQFQRVCPHWNPERNGVGKDKIYLLTFENQGKTERIPFDTNGIYWWCDVHVRSLGKPGGKVHIWGLETLGGKSSRGMSKEQFSRERQGKGMGFSGLANWDLV